MLEQYFFYSHGLSKTSWAEISLSRASLGICIKARTLAVLWLTIALGPKKSGSCAAASTASRTFHDDADSVFVVVPWLRCDNADVEEVEGGNKEGVGVAVPLPLLDEEEDRRPANISSNPPMSSSRDGGRGVTVRRILEEEPEVNDGGKVVVAVKAETASDWV